MQTLTWRMAYRPCSACVDYHVDAKGMLLTKCIFHLAPALKGHGVNSRLTGVSSISHGRGSKTRLFGLRSTEVMSDTSFHPGLCGSCSVTVISNPFSRSLGFLFHFLPIAGAPRVHTPISLW